VSFAFITGSFVSRPLLAALSGSNGISCSGSGGFTHAEKQFISVGVYMKRRHYERSGGESWGDHPVLPGHLVFKSLDGVIGVFKE
jgi:hypothetical protein